MQVHAELTRAMMHRWVVRGAHRFELPGAQVGREHLAGRMIWDMRLRLWLAEFLQGVFGASSVQADAEKTELTSARRGA